MGGEPIRKEDAKREIQDILQEAQTKKGKKQKKDQKAILNSVEQLNLAPMDALKNYYQVCAVRGCEETEWTLVMQIGNMYRFGI